MIRFLLISLLTIQFSFSQYTGYKPYLEQFGPNQIIYESGANWKIFNEDEDDMIFAVVNISDRVVAHAYISAGESFMFKDLPVGSYSYKFESDGSYFEKTKLIKFTGCDPNVYICNGDPEWEIQVWVETTSGYASGEISKKAFFN